MESFELGDDTEKIIARDSSNQTYVQSIIKEELDFRENPVTEDLATSENLLQSIIKEELDIQDFKEEFENFTTSRIHLQCIIKEELDTENVKDERVDFITLSNCVQSAIKEDIEFQDCKKDPLDLTVLTSTYDQSTNEELETKNFKQESGSTTPTTCIQSIVKEELILEDFKEEPDLTSSPENACDNEQTNSFNNPTHGEDMLVDTPDFADSNKLKCIKKRSLKRNRLPAITSSTKPRSSTKKRHTVSSKFSKTSVVQSPEKSSAKNEASTSRPLPDSFIVKNLDIAIKEFARTYCSECKKHRPVKVRRARCATCIATLRYDCVVCQTTYKTFSDLSKHLKVKHIIPVKSDKIFECDNCQKTFDFLKRFNEHRKGCLGESSFPCQQCDYVARFKSNLNSHVKSAHNHFEANCCGIKYTNERSFKRHVKVYCGKGKPISCHHCSFKTYRKDQIMDHLKAKHSYVF